MRRSAPSPGALTRPTGATPRGTDGSGSPGRNRRGHGRLCRSGATTTPAMADRPLPTWIALLLPTCSGLRRDQQDLCGGDGVERQSRPDQRRGNRRRLFDGLPRAGVSDCCAAGACKHAVWQRQNGTRCQPRTPIPTRATRSLFTLAHCGGRNQRGCSALCGLFASFGTKLGL